MGNILIGIGLVALVAFILYLAWDKEIQEEYEGGWKYWWCEWFDNEERGLFIALAVAIFLCGWGISTAITRGIVTEKHKQQKESAVISYNGLGDNVFTIGRHDNCYYMLQEVDGKLEQVQLYESTVHLVPSISEGKTAVLTTEYTVKKILRSKMPFMFLIKKDKVKESTGCGCGSNNSYILQVPSNFIFIDKYNQ